MLFFSFSFFFFSLNFIIVLDGTGRGHEDMCKITSGLGLFLKVSDSDNSQ